MAVDWHGDPTVISDLRARFEAALGSVPQRGPALHVYFPTAPPSAEVIAAAAERAVIPVVANAPAAADLHPSLRSLNALLCDRYGEHWSDAVVEEVLTRLLLPRRIRRVFVSYRRIDAAPIAAQLFDVLTRLGFQVFLDTASIEVGRDFQHELWWWLTDADLVILLASPRLTQSDWIRQEIAATKNMGVGVLHVTWPDACFPSKQLADGRTEYLRPDLGQLFGSQAFFRLNLEDLENPGAPGVGALAEDTALASFPPDDTKTEVRHVLAAHAVEALVASALRRRVQAVLERRIDLIGRVRKAEELKGRTVTPGQSADELHSHGRDGAELIRVLPCRPDPVLVVEGIAATERADVARGRVTYLEYDRQDPRATALDRLATRRAGRNRKGFRIDMLQKGSR